MAHKDVTGETFRGAVESHPLAALWPFTAARLTVAEDVLVIKQVFEKEKVISHDDVLSLLVKEVRFPFARSTVIEIRYRENRQLRELLFIPWAANALIESLKRAGLVD